MPAGRPAKPIEQKRRTGRSPGVDSGGRRLPEPVVTLAAVAEIPDPPDTLQEAGREAWDRLWTAAQGWLSPKTDLDLLTRLCEAHDLRAAMRQALAEEGFYVDGSMGQRRPNPLIDKLLALEKAMTAWEGLCGFTPSDRARLGYAEVKKQSKLDELLSKRTRESG